MLSGFKTDCPVLEGHKLGFLCPDARIYGTHFSQWVTVRWFWVSLLPIMVDVGGTFKFNYCLLEMNKLT